MSSSPGLVTHEIREAWGIFSRHAYDVERRRKVAVHSVLS
jgi:hypothetical protein